MLVENEGIKPNLKRPVFIIALFSSYCNASTINFNYVVILSEDTFIT